MNPAETANLIEQFHLWVTWHKKSPHWHVCPSEDSRGIARHDDLHIAVRQAVGNLNGRRPS